MNRKTRKAHDPDNPEWTDEELANAKPLAEALPELAGAMRRNVGGRPRLDNPKRAISIRLDAEVIDKFKATGPRWQTRIDKILKAAKL